MLTTVNPSEAPKGMKALPKTEGCSGCAYRDSNPMCPGWAAISFPVSCFGEDRRDGAYVIFDHEQEASSHAAS